MGEGNRLKTAHLQTKGLKDIKQAHQILAGFSLKQLSLCASVDGMILRENATRNWIIKASSVVRSPETAIKNYSSSKREDSPLGFSRVV